MQNLIKVVILILSHVLASNVALSQDRQLPDFSKAEKISHEQLSKKTALVWSGGSFVMPNACEVGSYDVQMYFEKDGIVYDVISFQVRCMNQGFFATYPKHEQNRLSSGIDAFAHGHWWAVCRIGCGKVYEYNVDKNGIVRSEYEVNCK